MTIARMLAVAALSTGVAMDAGAQVPANARIDSLMAPYADASGPGASVMVLRHGAVVYAKAYGLADVDSQAPVTTATNFRLASLSKQFTATTVMMLAGKGRLAYDDEITRYVSGLPAFARGVTVRQLLNHTSGLPDYEDFVPDTQTVQAHDGDVPAFISHAAAPKFAAGTKYDYSNTGYALLALIVERVTGQRYADALRTMIFTPLGMTGTVAYEAGRSTVTHRAYGHSVRGGVVKRTDQSNTSAVLGDGGIYSSAVDMAKWHRAMDAHILVSAEAQRMAWTPPVLPAGAKTEYGFGWFADSVGGLLRVRHHGESRGFTNGVVKFPAQRLTVVVLTNRSGGAPWDVAQHVAEEYLGPAVRSAPWRP
ncbi:MAG: serine hydrolase domain-containing protein [Gemmatimonadaceae bacterium]